MFYAVCKLYRIGDLEEYDGVDLHGDIILGDYGLRFEVNDLFLDGNPFRHTVNERHQKMDAGTPCLVESAETLNDVDICLRYDADAGDKYQNDENNHEQ